jgi:putative heme-binding domain-containing protein
MRILLALSLLLTASAHAAPLWIWGSAPAKDKDRISFRKTFTLPAKINHAELSYTCDNGATANINGKALPKNRDWMQATTFKKLLPLLKEGENTITVDATNEGGTAGFILKIKLMDEKGTMHEVVTDRSWESSVTGSNQWSPAREVGKYGAGPWGAALDKRRPGDTGATTVLDPKEIVCLPGFKVEHLYTVPKDDQGSWVAITVDNKGRLITGDQYGSLYRITPPAIGSTEKAKVEELKVDITGAHGLLHAFNSLYLMKNEEAGDHGLYRLKDTNGDDQYDEVKLLRKLKAGGEHGCHSMVLSPDGKSIIINAGNHSLPPEPLEHSRAARVWQEDHLVARMPDANGHARNIMAPGGYICIVDPEGQHWDMHSYGFRNEFDICFNDQGELFTYDADMEWDIGSPWYRPTRVNHCVSGADYGWRNGSGKWPAYYPDSLGAVVDIGPGSPTGVAAGTRAKFPAKYQHAVFINDWTYGTMYAVHLKPAGASYIGEKEEFISGKPLPLTDLVIHPQDGAMYFMVGGRRTQSGLYRCVYTGSESTEPAAPLPPTVEMKQRRELESLHLDGSKIDYSQVMPYLSHSDRNLRYAARVALERRPTAEWASAALALKEPLAVIETTIALARVGDKTQRDALVQHIDSLPWANLTTEQQLAATRALSLILIRMGKPEGELLAKTQSRYDALYPAQDAALNRELCQLLVGLSSNSVVSKTVQLMATTADDHADVAEQKLLARNDGYAKAANEMQRSRPNRQQIWYAYCLRTATTGWTPESRKAFFSWFPRTGLWKGGNSFRGFLNNMRSEALANVADAAERKALDEISAKLEVAPIAANLIMPQGPGQNWTLEQALALTEGGLKGRNYERGKSMFTVTMCATCHRFNGEGGSIGPDVSGAGNRYTMRDFLENIISPSKVVSDQYESHEIKLKNGNTVIGRIIVEENEKVFVAINPFAVNDTMAIAETDIVSKKPYAISMMPPGLINALNAEELKDLIAYVMSGGNAQDKAFTK